MGGGEAARSRLRAAWPAFPSLLFNSPLTQVIQVSAFPRGPESKSGTNYKTLGIPQTLCPEIG